MSTPIDWAVGVVLTHGLDNLFRALSAAASASLRHCWLPITSGFTRLMVKDDVTRTVSRSSMINAVIRAKPVAAAAIHGVSRRAETLERTVVE